MAQRTRSRRKSSTGRYFVYVVQVPPEWEPIGWHDRPPRAEEVELAGCFTRRMARGLLKDFNQAELAARRQRRPRNLWMVAQTTKGGAA